MRTDLFRIYLPHQTQNYLMLNSAGQPSPTRTGANAPRLKSATPGKPSLLVCLTLALLCVHALPLSAKEPTLVDFENDLIPVFTKLGCNVGACHGAAIGRGGFKLSLYGGNPAADYHAIVQELEGRRVNLFRPDQSLIYLKPSQSITHEGGYLIEEGAESERLLLEWIRQGAQQQPQRKLLRVEVQPRRHVFEQINDKVQLRSFAHYSDGSRREVTRWTVFTPEDDSGIDIDKKSNAKILRRGRQIVVARYLTEVQPIELLTPLNSSAETAQTSSNSKRLGFIDVEIERSLSILGLPKSQTIDDNAFRRRVSLDLTGRLPFVIEESLRAERMPSSGSKEPFDRSKYLKRILASEEFVQYWSLQLAKIFRVSPGTARDASLGTGSSNRYHTWLAEQLRKGTSYKELAAQMVLSEGNTREVGPANFYRTVTNAREQAELFSELFMGSRMRCANCHNHPLDRWTQDDYHGLAAIFAKMRLGDNVSIKPDGEVTHPRTLEPAIPRIPGGEFLKSGKVDKRVQLVDWLTATENPYFAKAIVNRLWKHMMGRGLIEPVDDLRATNPATHPELLDKLAKNFVEHGYDLRHTLMLIASSQAYSRSSAVLVSNAADDRFYSHAVREPLGPEVLADAISDILGLPEKYGDEELGTRAIALMNPRTPSRSLDVLGRCDRTDSCEGSAEVAGGLPTKLHMLNGGLLNDRISAKRGRLGELLRQESNSQALDIISEFYLLALQRQPSSAEMEFWSAEFKTREDLSTEQQQTAIESRLEDFLWALLSSQEFVGNP
ncbi:MAG: DUF1553 domain-containing protein [Planctomycetota bacterium]|nr:DUF1553 domain-containing protein [Planctomycetota bacterium]